MNIIGLPINEYDNDIKFVIIMATYNRPNGKTPIFLDKAISQILIQLYLINLLIIGTRVV